MTSVLYPEKLLLLDDACQPSLPLAADGVQRYVWESRFGEILIEIAHDQVFVNGQVVEPAASPAG